MFYRITGKYIHNAIVRAVTFIGQVIYFSIFADLVQTAILFETFLTLYSHALCFNEAVWDSPPSSSPTRDEDRNKLRGRDREWSQQNYLRFFFLLKHST
jgi:hypothetical protein